MTSSDQDLVVVPRNEPTAEMAKAWTDAAPPDEPALLVRYRAMMATAACSEMGTIDTRPMLHGARFLVWDPTESVWLPARAFKDGHGTEFRLIHGYDSLKVRDRCTHWTMMPPPPPGDA